MIVAARGADGDVQRRRHDAPRVGQQRARADRAPRSARRPPPSRRPKSPSTTSTSRRSRGIVLVEHAVEQRADAARLVAHRDDHRDERPLAHAACPPSDARRRPPASPAPSARARTARRALAPRRACAACSAGSARISQRARDEGVAVAGATTIAFDTVVDQLAGAADVGGHHRQPARHRLEHGVRQALPVARSARTGRLRCSSAAHVVPLAGQRRRPSPSPAARTAASISPRSGPSPIR